MPLHPLYKNIIYVEKNKTTWERCSFPQQVKEAAKLAMKTQASVNSFMASGLIEKLLIHCLQRALMFR